MGLWAMAAQLGGSKRSSRPTWPPSCLLVHLTNLSLPVPTADSTRRLAGPFRLAAVRRRAALRPRFDPILPRFLPVVLALSRSMTSAPRRSLLSVWLGPRRPSDMPAILAYWTGGGCLLALATSKLQF